MSFFYPVKRFIDWERSITHTSMLSDTKKRAYANFFFFLINRQNDLFYFADIHIAVSLFSKLYVTECFTSTFHLC